MSTGPTQRRTLVPPPPATPPPSSRNHAAWSPFSQEHMEGRFCVTCHAESAETLVVKCAECAGVDVDTWFCAECLDDLEDCVRCSDRVQTATSGLSCGVASASSLVIGSSSSALSTLTPHAELGRNLFNQACAVGGNVTSWLPTAVKEFALSPLGITREEDSSSRFKPSPPQSPPPPLLQPPPPPSSPPPFSLLRSGGVGATTTRGDSSSSSRSDSRSDSRGECSKEARRASHPLAVVLRRLKAGGQGGGGGGDNGDDNGEDVCAICLEPPEDPVSLDCGHAYCARCVAALQERRVNQVCPQCRGPLAGEAANEAEALYDKATRLFIPVQRAVERGRCGWGRLPLELQTDLDQSMALLQRASLQGHPRARACLGLGKRVLLHGLRRGGDAEYCATTPCDGETNKSAAAAAGSGSAGGSWGGSGGSGGGGEGGGGGRRADGDSLNQSGNRSNTAISGHSDGRGGTQRDEKKSDESKQRRGSGGGKELNGAVGVATAFDGVTNRFVVQLEPPKGDNTREQHRTRHPLPVQVLVKAANIRMER